MLYCILGNSGAGKTTICKSIQRSAPNLHNLISCTTRPPRGSEHNDSEYHFVDDKIFSLLQERGMLYENRVYDTTEGQWKYGTLNSDLENAKIDDYIMAVSPSQFCKYYEAIKDHIVPIVLYADFDTRLQRVLARGTGETEEEIARRLNYDQDYLDIDKVPMEFVLPNYNKCVSLTNIIIIKLIEYYRENKFYQYGSVKLEKYMFQTKLQIMYDGLKSNKGVK